MKLGKLITQVNEEDDKKLIKSGGHEAWFDVTMLTNMAI